MPYRVKEILNNITFVCLAPGTILDATWLAMYQSIPSLVATYETSYIFS